MGQLEDIRALLAQRIAYPDGGILHRAVAPDTPVASTLEMVEILVGAWDNLVGAWDDVHRENAELRRRVESLGEGLAVAAAAFAAMAEAWTALGRQTAAAACEVAHAGTQAILEADDATASRSQGGEVTFG